MNLRQKHSSNIRVQWRAKNFTMKKKITQTLRKRFIKDSIGKRKNVTIPLILHTVYCVRLDSNFNSVISVYIVEKKWTEMYITFR